MAPKRRRVSTKATDAVDAELARWRPIYTPLICDELDKMGLRDQAMDTPAIHPTRPDSFVAGPALTMSIVTHPGKADPAKVFEMFETMEPGQVVVVATNGHVRAVTDGMVRDVRQINRMGFTCFSRGPSPLDSAGRAQCVGLNVPVICGGVVVNPGDFIVADDDGIVVIPKDKKKEVFKKANERLHKESTIRQELEDGDCVRAVVARHGIL